MSSLLAENIMGRALQSKRLPSTCDCAQCQGAREMIDRELQPIRDAFAVMDVDCTKCNGAGCEDDGSSCQGCAAIQIATNLLEVEAR